MAQKRFNRSAEKSTVTLARLRKLYGHQPQLQYDKFGRRMALPSEIANQLKQLKAAPGA